MFPKRLAALAIALAAVTAHAHAEDAMSEVRRLLDQQEYSRALLIVAPMAEQGNTNAMFIIGKMYLNGTGIRKDEVQALAWFYRAAQTGHIKAMREVATSYERGRGAPVNVFEAYQWRLKASSLGDKHSELKRIQMAESGTGTVQDKEKALDDLEALADSEFAPAQMVLASKYLAGDGVRKSDKRAFEWLTRAANNGLADGHHALGVLHLNGWGTKRDEDAALQSFRSASSIGGCGLSYTPGSSVSAFGDQIKACLAKTQ